MRPGRALVAAIVLLAACGPTAVETAPPTSASPGPLVADERARADIQALLDKQYQAKSAKDLARFQETLDQTRLAFRRCQTQDFDIASRLGPGRQGRVLAVEPALEGYLRAYVGDATSGYTRRYFRRDAGRWLMTEPTLAELGDERSRTVGGLVVRYWLLDEDVVEPIANATLAARAQAEKELRNTPIPYFVKLTSTQETAGEFGRCTTQVLATYQEQPVPQLTVRELYFAAPREPTAYSRAILTHESLHWVQHQNVTGTQGGIAWWLVEGWPDFVAGTRSLSTTRALLCGTTPVPTYKQLVDPPPQDVDTPPEVFGQYYAYANSMVEYVYATRGADSYWRLYEAYAKSGFRVAFQASDAVLAGVLSTTPDRFRADWLAFARKKYC